MIKFRYSFLLDAESGRSDLKLRMRVRWSGHLVSFGLGYRVESSKWSGSTFRCINSTTHGSLKVPASEINAAIREFEGAVLELFAGYNAQGVNPTPDGFRDDFNVLVGRKTKPTDQLSLFDVFDEFVISSGRLNSWSLSMHQKFQTFRRHLFNFNPHLSFSDLSIFDLPNSGKLQQDLPSSVLTNFVNYLSRQGLRNVSIDKNIKMMRWFLRWSAAHGYYSGNLHETFRPRLKGADGVKEVIHLTWSELLGFYDFDFFSHVKVKEKAAALSRVRDVFCFCSFTGLRYSDVSKLLVSDVRDGVIHVVTQKTDDVLKIELNEFSQALFEKYAAAGLPDGRLLPVISNQKMNDQLKVAARIAGLDSPQKIIYFKGSTRYEETRPLHEVISSHAGRRTFIVNALYLGIPAEVIMRWSGHKSFASMKPYIKIVDELKAREMSKFKR